MRSIPATYTGISARHVARVISLHDLINEWEPQLRFLVPIHSADEMTELESLASAGLENITACFDRESVHFTSSPKLSTVEAELAKLELHDVVAFNSEKTELIVLYRQSDIHHSVFLTNRCNSNCLMCSQPPTKHDDAWLINEACQIAAHIQSSPVCIGLSGGEPLLLGASLRHVIDEFTTRHPKTVIEVLTNGRLLTDKNLAKVLLQDLSQNIRWLVPLYGHADFLHDFVVQSPGAFEETIDGMLTLQAYQQPIQLRVVLIDPTLRVLPEICRFIGRSLPFVQEVALMACEPIGFALANRDICDVDLADWHEQMMEAISALERAQVPVLLMNAPLCALPVSLRKYAQKSISDWKQAFPQECEGCIAKEHCSGLFSWYERGWRPTVIKAFEKELNL